MEFAKKYLSAWIILLIGLSFLIYGIVKAPVTDNSAAIYQRQQLKYDCFRGTADARYTDKYCINAKLDPTYKATKHYVDSWTKISAIFIVLGLIDIAYLYSLKSAS